jgi:hypothetical protein
VKNDTIFMLTNGTLLKCTNGTDWEQVASSSATLTLKRLIGASTAELYAQADDNLLYVSKNGKDWKPETIDDAETLLPTAHIAMVSYPMLLADSTDINLDSIVYVRVVDVVGTNNPDFATFDQYGNIVMDPYPTNGQSSGFDLDGVAVMNWNYTEPQGINNTAENSVSLYPNPANSQVLCSVEGEGQHLMSLYNTSGQLLLQQTFSGRQISFNTSSIADGMYILRVDGKAQRLVIQH